MTVRLVPATRAVAVAVCQGGDVDDAVLAVGLTRVPDWPHADTPDALRPLADHPGVVAEGPGTFLVVQDGVVVGDCGWFGPPDSLGEAEVGYGLAPSVRGRGLGTETLRMLLAWVEAQPGVTKVRAEVLPGNAPSLTLLARLGFAVTGNTTGYVVLTR